LKQLASAGQTKIEAPLEREMLSGGRAAMMAPAFNSKSKPMSLLVRLC
jgi:hypothetical protein